MQSKHALYGTFTESDNPSKVLFVCLKIKYTLSIQENYDNFCEENKYGLYNTEIRGRQVFYEGLQKYHLRIPVRLTVSFQNLRYLLVTTAGKDSLVFQLRSMSSKLASKKDWH